MSGDGGPRDASILVSILEEIRDLFLKHDFMEQGTVVAEIIDLARLGSDDFVARLRGGEIWGSAGSVADSVSLQRDLEPVSADTERDSVAMMQSLIRLADEMKAQGISSDGSQSIAGAFRRGLEVLRSRGESGEIGT